MAEHPTRSDSPVTVQCYAGYKGGQEPQRFSLGERWLKVEKVLKEWRGARPVVLLVRANDGTTKLLRTGKKRAE